MAGCLGVGCSAARNATWTPSSIGEVVADKKCGAPHPKWSEMGCTLRPHRNTVHLVVRQVGIPRTSCPRGPVEKRGHTEMHVWMDGDPRWRFGVNTKIGDYIEGLHR